MNRKHVLANAMVWAAAILASALVGVPPFLSVVLLPSLATASIVLTAPKPRTAGLR